MYSFLTKRGNNPNIFLSLSERVSLPQTVSAAIAARVGSLRRLGPDVAFPYLDSGIAGGRSALVSSSIRPGRRSPPPVFGHADGELHADRNLSRKNIQCDFVK